MSATIKMSFPQKENQLSQIYYISWTPRNRPHQGSYHHGLANSYQGQRSTIVFRSLQFLLQIHQRLLKNSQATIQVNTEGTQLGLDISMQRSILST